MSGKLAAVRLRLRRLRVDQTDPGREISRPARIALLVILAAGFVLVGGSRLDLGDSEARLGLAAGERVGPYGQVVGGWDPALWPVQVLTSQAWAWCEGGPPSSGAVRWPAALAAFLFGLILTKRVATVLGARASVFMGLCLFGSIACMDRSESVGIDWLASLAIIGALDRIVSKGSDWVSGLWATLAVLSGGWPPLAMVVLPLVVLGRPNATLSKRLLFPPILAIAAWSAWALYRAPAATWAAALTLPLTQSPAWLLGPMMFVFCLPWSPLAALLGFPSIRAGVSDKGRSHLAAWIQAAGVGLLAGTLVPGLAASARGPILAAMSMSSALVLDRAWAGMISVPARRALLWAALGTILVWGVLVGIAGSYLAAAVSYYRPLAIGLVATALLAVLVAFWAAWKGQTRWLLGAVLSVAVGIKVAYAGFYAPEWNYRFSQGPWGRAVGQWVPPNWPIFTINGWPHDFLFSTERPIRRLASPELLEYRLASHPQFILLADSEFEHWPEGAPQLVKVHEFEDPYGGHRVLARTAGEFRLALDDRDR
jgi:hypothetical protein